MLEMSAFSVDAFGKTFAKCRTDFRTVSLGRSWLWIIN